MTAKEKALEDIELFRLQHPMSDKEERAVELLLDLISFPKHPEPCIHMEDAFGISNEHLSEITRLVFRYHTEIDDSEFIYPGFMEINASLLSKKLITIQELFIITMRYILS